MRAAYVELIAMGWTDAIRLLHPEERIYTFWKYFRNAFVRDAGLRIDHLLLSPSLRERLTAAGVDKFVRSWEHTSDHAPSGLNWMTGNLSHDQTSRLDQPHLPGTRGEDINRGSDGMPFNQTSMPVISPIVLTR